MIPVVAILCAVAVLQGGAGIVPATAVLVDAARRYVEGYQRDFAFLIADEVAVQRASTRGRLTATRTTRGELFTTVAEADHTWMAVHDIHEVDGRPVPDRPDLREMLRRDPSAFVALRLAAANARFNIGRVTRNFNEPTLALLVFTPRFVGGVRFERESVRTVGTPAGNVTLATLRFEGRDGTSIVGSRAGRVRMQGSAVLDVATGQVHETTIRFANAQVNATLVTTYGHDPHVGLWVPVTFVETYAAPRTGDQTAAETTLTNYRRFEVTGRVKE